MDKKLQKYYDNRFDMMSSQGWKDLEEDLTKMYDEYKDINNCKGVDDFYFQKGQVDMLKYILSLKTMSEKVYEDINNEEEYTNT
jgi:hypothetical protein